MSCLTRAVNQFFEYDTPHIVHIRSKKVGILSRTVQACIIAYIIGYVILYQKGYQQFSVINSSVTTKLKGVVYTNFSVEEFKVPYPEVYNKLWDSADYVVPPQENGAFFVTTNAIITPNQTQGRCAEDVTILHAFCNPANNTCVKNEPIVNGNGVMTGECIPTGDKKNHSCEILAWCPVEVNSLPLGDDVALLEASKNFTVLIKNSIEFPLFNVKRRNVVNGSNSSYLSSCNYDSTTDPSCPIFRLGTIVKEAQEDYTKLAVQGGVLAIIINWDCNLDFNPEKNCNPTYRFRRLDDPDAKIAKGWNFRYAKYYGDNVRTLYKAYGIRFVILVQGRGGKLSAIPLLLNIGSGLALLSISTLVCDIIVLYLHKRKDFYYEKKFIQVNPDEAELQSDDEIISYHGDNGEYEPLQRAS